MVEKKYFVSSASWLPHLLKIEAEIKAKVEVKFKIKVKTCLL